MILEKLKVSADLSACSYLEAKKQCGIITEEGCLFISPDNIPTAESLKTTYMIDTLLPKDAWYVTGKYSGCFSPGAV